MSVRKKVWGSRAIISLLIPAAYYGLAQLHNGDKSMWEPYGHVSNVGETLLYIAGYIVMGAAAVALTCVALFYGTVTTAWVIHTLCTNAFGNPHDTKTLREWYSNI